METLSSAIPEIETIAQVLPLGVLLPYQLLVDGADYYFALERLLAGSQGSSRAARTGASERNSGNRGLSPNGHCVPLSSRHQCLLRKHAADAISKMRVKKHKNGRGKLNRQMNKDSDVCAICLDGFFTNEVNNSLCSCRISALVL